MKIKNKPKYPAARFYASTCKNSISDTVVVTRLSHTAKVQLPPVTCSNTHAVVGCLNVIFLIHLCTGVEM